MKRARRRRRGWSCSLGWNILSRARCTSGRGAMWRMTARSSTDTHKFGEAGGKLSERSDIILMVDEAYRTLQKYKLHTDRNSSTKPTPTYDNITDPGP